MISYLYNILEVSCSGYYKHFSNVTVQKRKSIEVRDLESRENILKAYNFKNRKKGARQIKMILSNVFDINYNLKQRYSGLNRRIIWNNNLIINGF